jgi:Spy/CpxP family protein refolding chaperone
LPDKGKGWLFVAVAAVSLAIGFAASSMAYRHGWLGGGRPPFIERMQRKLNLTPTQREQIIQIINETRSKVMNLRDEFQHQRHETMHQARARVRSLLTPEQQEKFDREFKSPYRRDHERGPGPHGGEGGPPPGASPDGGGPPP